MPPAVPRLGGLPLFGTLPAFLRDPLGLLQRARELGPVSRVELGFVDAVTVHHPDLVDHVFRSHRHNYVKDGPFWDSLRPLLGNGLPMSTGATWKRQRHLMQPQFHRRRLAGLADLIAEAVERTIRWKDVRDGWTEVDLGARIPRLTMDVVTTAIFGVQTDPARTQAIASALDFAAPQMFRSMVAKQLPRWVPIPGRNRFQQETARIRREVLRIIEERPRGSDGNDLLGLLVLAADESGFGMTHEQLVDEVTSLLIAGYDTTSTGLQWSLYFLARHPEHLGRLREEADAVLDGGAPTGADIRRLSYARWVMQEALRLYPPVWWLPRMAVHDDLLGGHHVPAGAFVAPVMYTVHRHPDFWEQPDVFDPERFSPARSQGRHPLAWIPFGAGPRKCIGQELSLMESALALSMISQRYEIEPSDRVIQPKLHTVLKPATPVRLRMRRRRRPRASVGVYSASSSQSSGMLMM